MKTDINEFKKHLNSESLSSGVLRSYLPEIYSLMKYREVNMWHHGETTFEHVKNVLVNIESLLSFNFIKEIELKDRILHYMESPTDEKSLYSRKEIFLLGTILHDIGKKDTYIKKDDNTTGFPNHEKVGKKSAKEILKRLKLVQSDIKLILDLIEFHASFNYLSSSLFKKPTDIHMRYIQDLISKLGENVFEISLLCFADFLSGATKDNIPELYSFQESMLKEIINLTSSMK